MRNEGGIDVKCKDTEHHLINNLFNREIKKSELQFNSLSVMNHHQSFLLVVSITFLASG